MRFERAEPVLPARNLDETRVFYRKLGFTAWFDGNVWPGYEIMSRGDLVVHFFDASELMPAANDGGCYWRVTDADRWYAECAVLGLPSEGIPRLTNVCDQPWGMREFVLVDPSGNLVRIGQDLDVPTVTVRPERAEDAPAIRVINERAFGGQTEGALVDALRRANKAAVSLVVEQDDRVVGHILFSPVSFEHAPPGLRGVGLAPMGVLPEFQRQGMGSRLVHEGLKACREAGYDIVVVVGHIDYYPRFGFVRAKDFGLENEYDVVEEFMVLELRRGALAGVGGLVKFAPEFNEAGA
jgi:putative acetyltransferase